ncbi:MAG TPA: hypothetical protein VEK07_08560 [Polyangiaceae bacterium]|nr:hypothetical protein [Polyangiaceae bacterium]
MSAESTPGWDNFFVAEVGAAAALSGLLFVAVSINLARVLSIEQMPERAAETLVVLMSVLVVATFGLVPHQTHAEFGVETAFTGLLTWLLSTRIQARAYRSPQARPWLLRRVIWTQIATLPFVAAGVLLVAGHESGFYWVVPGVLGSFASGLQNAWVLLIEILR